MFGRPVLPMVLAALGSGLVGGVLFAFSVFVMQALNRLPAAQSISAMQAINLTVVTPLFMLVLFGTAALCPLLAWWALAHRASPAARYVLLGSALYLGAVLLTATYHVPRNDALAAVNPLAGDAAQRWQSYASGWLIWNHVRTALAIAGAAAFTLASRAI